jgi:hypothetical protein
MVVEMELVAPRATSASLPTTLVQRLFVDGAPFDRSAFLDRSASSALSGSRPSAAAAATARIVARRDRFSQLQLARRARASTCACTLQGAA